MSIRVDGGVVRLTDTDFQDLVRGEAAPSLADALSVPGVPEALDAVRSPLAVLNVAVAGRSRLLSHQAWVTPDAVALLLDVREGERQLMALPPALLASGLARLLRLGPRRVAERAPARADGAVLAARADSAVLADLFSATEVLRRSAFETLDVDLAWNLGLSWPGGDRWLSGLDGKDGLWLVAGDEAAPRLEPSTATDVWRRLTTLLVGVDAPLAAETESVEHALGGSRRDLPA